MGFIEPKHIVLTSLGAGAARYLLTASGVFPALTTASGIALALPGARQLQHVEALDSGYHPPPRKHDAVDTITGITLVAAGRNKFREAFASSSRSDVRA
jgi:hypothetical protein